MFKTRSSPFIGRVPYTKYNVQFFPEKQIKLGAAFQTTDLKKVVRMTIIPILTHLPSSTLLYVLNDQALDVNFSKC